MRLTKRYAAVGLAVAGLAVLPPLASADPLPEGCDKERGTITCGPAPVINPAGNPVQGQQVTTTQKGSFQSSHDPVTCVEPGNSGKCK